MKIIIITNFKKKIYILVAVLITSLLLFQLTNSLIRDKLIYHLTIDNYLSFSYPASYKIDDILVNNSVKDNSIETNFSFNRAQVQDYINFQSKVGNFSFSYPSSFILSQKDFSGSDILYHIDYHNDTNTAHGFVQVWNMPYPLEDFLAKSKEVSIQHFIRFTSKPVVINNVAGYLWDYSLQADDGVMYKGMEVFLKKDGKMYRVSYFVPEKLWNKNQTKIFWNIVNSFKIS